MLRKLGLALFAVTIVLAGSAGISTSASAHGWHGGGWRGGGFHRGWGGPRFYGPRFYGGPVFYGGGCVVRRWVPTPWGWRWRWVNRCW